MKKIMLSAATVLLAATPVLVSAPAEAKPRAPRAAVTLNASATTADSGEEIYLTGRVKSKAKVTRVVLQSRTGGRWTPIQSSTAAKTFSFPVIVREGRTQYRVKAFRTVKARAGTSHAVAVVGNAEVVNTPELSQQQALMLQYTNEFRAQNGKAPLLPMAELNTVAQDWTTYMAESGDFSHNPDFFDQYPQDNLWGGGENIAYGYASPRAVVDGWIDSPGHRANMLGDFTHIGLGWAQDANGRDYWTQNFASYEEDGF